MKTIILCLVTYFGAVFSTFAQEPNKDTIKDFGFKIWAQTDFLEPMKKSIVYADDLKEWTETNYSWLNDIPDFFNNYTGGISSGCVYIYFESGTIYEENGKLKFKKLSQKEIKEIYQNYCVNNVNCLSLMK